MSASDYIKYAKVCFLSSLLSLSAQASASDVWQKSDPNEPAHNSTVQQFTLDIDSMQQQLSLNDVVDTRVMSASTKSLSVNPSIQLPLPSGEMVWVELLPDVVMDVDLAERFTDIKSYRVQGDGVKGSLTLSGQGVRAMLETPDGVVFIEPSDIAYGREKRVSTGNNDQYTVFYHHVAEQLGEHSKVLGQCEHDHEQHVDGTQDVMKKSLASAYSDFIKTKALKDSEMSDIIVYRLALSATAEYTRYHGGVDEAMASMVATIQRVNQIFVRDLGIRLQLIGQTPELIFEDIRTDPFSNDDKFAMMEENQDLIDRVIGVDNYDVGHVFSTSDGGVSSLGVVCRNGQKARGVTGLSRPTGDYFAISMVAHEIGHQLSAMHSFNGSSLSCKNRTAVAAYEPGSGSTIMSYAGHCGSEDLQHRSDPVFHASSIAQIQYFTKKSFGAACGNRISIDNRKPIVSAGKNFVIPASTAFTLNGSGVDQDRDSLSYSWEQIDRGDVSTSQDMADSGNRPIFRSFLPVAESSRTFPRFAQLLNQSNNLGEWLPTTERSMNFRLTARDARGGVGFDDVVVDVAVTAEPFSIESPEGGVSYNDELDVRWNVAETDLPPINCTAVDILISHNSGEDFLLLLPQTPNDGQELVLLPGGEHEQALLKIRCSDNIFFAITHESFSYYSTNNIDLAVNDDEFLVLTNSSDVVLDVLANDIGIENAQIELEIIDSPSAGGTAEVVQINDRPVIVYSPSLDYDGDELFAYQIIDSVSQREMPGQVRIDLMSAEDAANDDRLVVVLPSTEDESTGQADASREGGGAISLGLFALFFIALMALSKRRVDL